MVTASMVGCMLSALALLARAELARHMTAAAYLKINPRRARRERGKWIVAQAI